MSERYMKDFNGEKVFCLEYDKETLRSMVEEKQENIIVLRNYVTVLRRKLSLNREALKRNQILIDKLMDENKKLKNKLKEGK